MSGLISDCLSKGCELKLPPTEDAIMAPFIHIKMKASGVEITVGNESTPGNKGHHAVIKEFEFGFSERPICRVVIHDEQGSSFVKFMENLLMDLKCNVAGKINQAEVKFGWIKSNCNNATFVETSQPIYVMINTVTCVFDNGKMIYELEMTDLMDRHAEARNADSQGEDGDKGEYITTAIVNLFTDEESPPSVEVVEFLKMNPDGKGSSPILFKNHDGDPKKGPKGKWTSKNLDKMAIALDWLGQATSKDDKSFYLTYDPYHPKGKVIVWEDPQPNCDERISVDNCIGRYIVNGGKDSRVISFNPRFKFAFVNLASSGGFQGTQYIDSNPGQGGKNSGHDCATLSRDQIKSGGAQLAHGASENHQNTFSGADADKEAMNSRNKQLKAYFTAATTEPIEADLVIIGDPSLPTPLLTRYLPIEIVFINPYHISSNGKGGVDWLAAPFCNEVLTNKAWRVKGVNHMISDGRFVTTITIFLPAPGVHLDVGQPFGGVNSGGWTPPSNCR